MTLSHRTELITGGGLRLVRLLMVKRTCRTVGGRRITVAEKIVLLLLLLMVFGRRLAGALIVALQIAEDARNIVLWQLLGLKR